MEMTSNSRTPAGVELKGVVRSFGSTCAVSDLNLSIRPGEFFSLLGPSGCGKTTTLRLIAGLDRPARGSILIGDQVVASDSVWVSPERRGVGIVFQDQALFPHLTVAQNIAFGLAGWSRKAARQRVAELLLLVGLDGLANRYPHELSGGQGQRVALARSLAPSPRVMLLDEPFSNLDTGLREELRGETRRILTECNTTTILVTHEQEEAFSLSDRVGVLNRGCLQQVGTPPEVYHRPATRFVADFVGKADFIPGVVGAQGLQTILGTFTIPCAGWECGHPVDLMIRPDVVDFTVDPAGAVVVSGLRFVGASVLYELTLSDGRKIHSLQSSSRMVEPGTRVNIQIDATQLMAFSPNGSCGQCQPLISLEQVCVLHRSLMGLQAHCHIEGPTKGKPSPSSDPPLLPEVSNKRSL
jgi:iron(III) transport system ATP-binding protein